MKLHEALEQYEDGLYEPALIVLYTWADFPGEIHFRLIAKNPEGKLALYSVGATAKANLKSMENWLNEKGWGHTLDSMDADYKKSSHWQLLTASQFIAFIQHIFQTNKEPEI